MPNTWDFNTMTYPRYNAEHVRCQDNVKIRHNAEHVRFPDNDLRPIVGLRNGRHFFQNTWEMLATRHIISVSSRRLRGGNSPPKKKFQIPPKTQQTAMLCSGVNGAPLPLNLKSPPKSRGLDETLHIIWSSLELDSEVNCSRAVVRAWMVPTAGKSQIQCERHRYLYIRSLWEGPYKLCWRNLW